MIEHGKTWVIVLAGGEGVRLRSLTTISEGISIPKQFCSLQGGPSLLEGALQRAQTIASSEQICAVVTAQHRRWWQPSLHSLPIDNVIVEPQQCGTGIGILWSLLRILRRDPEARVVLLPADHHVRQEQVLSNSIRQAIVHLHCRESDVLLLGINPEEVDVELGYIMPGFSVGHSRFHIARFIEKPSLSRARELIAHGALCNTFITAAYGRALLQMFMFGYEDIVRVMRDAMHRDQVERTNGAAVTNLYRDLPLLDFSHDIIEGQEANMQVLEVPSCGWSDLGTPNRVGETLRFSSRVNKHEHTVVTSIAPLDLATQFRLQQAI